VHQGQAYVTSIINAAMEGPDWDSTAIFLAWDDWGGFYDNAVPPAVDQNGYGLRVPSLVISPYARRGYVDHQILSSDAYLKFIEDDFLDGGAPQPGYRRPPRPATRCPRGRGHPGQPRAGLRLRPDAESSGPAGHQPADRLAVDPGLLPGETALRRLHHSATRRTQGGP
jgi:hypothetical protein